MNMTLNRLPSITWYWLKMNNGSLEGVDPAGEASLKEEVPAQVTAGMLRLEDLPEQATGMGKDMTALVRSSGTPVHSYEIGDNQKADGVLRLGYAFEHEARSVNAVSLRAAKHSSLTVVQDFSSAPEAEGFAAVQTRYLVEEGAVLKLIQIERLGSGYTFLNDIGGRVENSGRVELIHLVLDGGHTYLGVQTDLAGYKSALKADIGYRVGEDHTLDINYFANHTGKKTTCDINAKGVLRDHARKVFRGTIDLKKGSSGSVGNEKEDVLMMDDTVRNQTLPVILCTEEDVVGNHGATIGRLDESVLFYLQSRGMDREAVYEMMADARVASVVHLIEDKRTRAEAERYLGGISDSIEE